MVNPSPIPPVSSGHKTDSNFNIKDAKRRLGEAHWDHGQSATKYQSINMASYNPPNQT